MRDTVLLGWVWLHLLKRDRFTLTMASFAANLLGGTTLVIGFLLLRIHRSHCCWHRECGLVPPLDMSLDIVRPTNVPAGLEWTLDYGMASVVAQRV